MSRTTFGPGAVPCRRIIISLGLTLVLGLFGLPLHASDSRLAEAEACTLHAPRYERLTCYDALFQATDEQEPQKDDARPALWHAAQAQERNRKADDMALMSGEREKGGVLLTVPALGSVPPRPLLVIACENRITHFQLHLHETIDASRADLALNSGARVLNQAWRIRDSGHVVGGGRGLPAIATLRELLQTHKLTLHSDLDALDGLRFDLTNLRERLHPLRDACRW